MCACIVSRVSGQEIEEIDRKIVLEGGEILPVRSARDGEHKSKRGTRSYISKSSRAWLPMADSTCTKVILPALAHVCMVAETGVLWMVVLMA